MSFVLKHVFMKEHKNKASKFNVSVLNCFQMIQGHECRNDKIYKTYFKRAIRIMNRFSMFTLFAQGHFMFSEQIADK